MAAHVEAFFQSKLGGGVAGLHINMEYRWGGLGWDEEENEGYEENEGNKHTMEENIGNTKNNIGKRKKTE